jgi:epoxyqueuosine reductase
MSLADDVLAYALGLGFDRAGILPIGPPVHAAAFADWLAAGYHGEMAYLAVRAAERGDPTLLAPAARSMIVLAARYSPPAGAGVGNHLPQTEKWPQPLGAGPAGSAQVQPVGFQPPIPTARIARYACSADYHDLLKRRLYELDAFIRQRTGRTALGKVCVDTAPLLERDFAAQAGLGFIGRNTCLITPGLGSWTTLAALLIPEALTSRPPLPTPKLRASGEGEGLVGRAGGCGRCTRCLDACPTHAFVAPYLLDARRCISYLTIELRGPIPRDLRPLMGNWVFGCDVCQEVCPYNRAIGHSERSEESLSHLLTLDDASFRARFRGTPILRAKRRGLVRNACVAAGNSGDPALAPLLTTLLADPEPLVRGHAGWALGRLGGAADALRAALAVEGDAWVREELALAADFCLFV